MNTILLIFMEFFVTDYYSSTNQNCLAEFLKISVLAQLR